MEGTESDEGKRFNSLPCQLIPVHIQMRQVPEVAQCRRHHMENVLLEV